MSFFPFMMEIGGQAGLVVGGGRIALHKVKVLLPFGVKLNVVSEEICPELSALEGERLQLTRRAFVDSDLYTGAEPVCFVVAATGDEALQSHVSELCKARRIPVNVVDVKEKCSFFFPAVTKQEELVVAVSTGGKSPAAAGYIRDEIARSLPGYYGDLINELGKYRELAIERIPAYGERKEFFRGLLAYGKAHDGVLTEETVLEELAHYTDQKRQDICGSNTRVNGNMAGKRTNCEE